MLKRFKMEKRALLTCPVAMKMAVTRLAAWALKPPMLPATIDPTRFLLMFKSTRLATDVFRRVFTTWLGTTASQMTDLPRPSILNHQINLSLTQKIDYNSVRVKQGYSNRME